MTEAMRCKCGKEPFVFGLKGGWWNVSCSCSVKSSYKDNREDAIMIWNNNILFEKLVKTQELLVIANRLIKEAMCTYDKISTCLIPLKENFL